MHYNGVDWIDKPKVSDGLWICWVYNPTYPLESGICSQNTHQGQQMYPSGN